MARRAVLLVGCAVAASPAAAGYDYPTVVRADYVIACLAANGQTRENLYKCACAIDHIANELPFEEYEQVETILRVRQVPGDRSGLFRDVPWINEAIERFQAVERDASRACFGE